MTVDFQPWATGPGANVLSQADYLALFGVGGEGQIGFVAGTAISTQGNKLFRQASFVAAALATAVSATIGQDVLDDGNLGGLVAKIELMITTLIQSSNSSWQTGDTLWRPTADARAGFVRMNALSIGSASSGASERANADTAALYTLLWNTFSQSQCAVTGGRGASAAADFAANKPIKLLDMRGIAPFGLDGMGNSLAGRIVGGTPNVGGSGGGAETHTVSQGNLPAVALSVSGTAAQAGGHTHSMAEPIYSPQPVGSDGSITVDTPGILVYFFGAGSGSMITLTAGAHTHVVSGSTSNLGSGTALLTMPPYMLGAWYLKL